MSSYQPKENMMRRAIRTFAVVCCIAVSAALAGQPAVAAEVGATQKKAAVQIAPAPQPRSVDTAALDERVIALERENLVLREDLGKARLDLRTGLADQTKRRAEEMARMQQKIDELNAQVAADREKQSRRSRNTWIAIGLLAVGVVAAN